MRVEHDNARVGSALVVSDEAALPEHVRKEAVYLASPAVASDGGTAAEAAADAPPAGVEATASTAADASAASADTAPASGQGKRPLRSPAAAAERKQHLDRVALQSTMSASVESQNRN